MLQAAGEILEHKCKGPELEPELPPVVARMERVRKARGMTSNRLSFLVTDGRNGSYFSGLLSRGQVPSADKVMLIAEALEVSPLLFYTEFEQIEPLNGLLMKLETADVKTINRVQKLIADVGAESETSPEQDRG